MKTTEEKNEEFLLNIVHDIKSPIASINIALENLNSKNDILNEIYIVNRHNLEYIENLMENYSFKTGKYNLKYEYFNIVNTINEEIVALKLLIIEKNLKINLITSSDNIPIYSDKQMIRQVFLNLFTNAVKYSPNGEEIKIEATKLKRKVSVCITNHLNPDSKKSTGFGHQIINNALIRLNGKINHTKNKNKICFFVDLPVE